MDKTDIYKIISILRRASLRWGARFNAINNSRVERGKYKCSKCKKLFKRPETQVDHTIPVIPITGFDSWDELIPRLFCSEKGFKVMCKPCHKAKSTKENKLRAEHKKK